MGEHLHFHIHPLVVHFPIALFITALIFEILNLVLKKEVLHQAGYFNYILAVIATVVATLSGWREGISLELMHPLFYTHRNLGFAILGIALLSGAILPLSKRKSEKAFRFLFLIFLIIIAILVVVAAYYGGKLVYEYGVGVKK